MWMTPARPTWFRWRSGWRAIFRRKRGGKSDDHADRNSRWLPRLLRGGFDAGCVIRTSRQFACWTGNWAFDALLKQNQWEAGPRDRGGPRELSFEEQRRPGNRGTTQATPNR